jgi:hypothetical protein
MNLSITAIIAAMAVVALSLIGLVLGGMLVFDIAATRFSRLQLKQALTVVFLGFIGLMIIALLLDMVIP